MAIKISSETYCDYCDNVYEVTDGAQIILFETLEDKMKFDLFIEASLRLTIEQLQEKLK